MRSVLSSIVPSFSWNPTSARRGTYSSSGRLQVLLVEELRVGQAGAHDALVARSDDLGARGVAVGDEHEVVRQVPVGVAKREVALVREHRLADDSVRDVEEGTVEVGHEDGRPLDEVDDLVERLLRGVGGKPALRGDAGDALAYNLGAPLARDDDVDALERLDVALRAEGPRTSPGSIRRWPRVVRPAVRPQNSTGTTSSSSRQTSQRTGREKRLVARAPALGAQAREAVVDLAGGRGEHVAHDLGGGARRRRNVDPHVVLAVLLAHDELGGVDALAAREALGGLGGVAVRIERHRRGGAAEVLLERLGGAGDGRAPSSRCGGACPRTPPRRTRGAPRRAPPRRAPSCRRTTWSARSREAPRCRFRKRAPWSGPCYATSSFSRAIQASQHALATARTRRMYAARSVALMAPRESSRLKACEHFSTQS